MLCQSGRSRKFSNVSISSKVSENHLGKLKGKDKNLEANEMALEFFSHFGGT